MGAAGLGFSEPDTRELGHWLRGKNAPQPDPRQVPGEPRRAGLGAPGSAGAGARGAGARRRAVGARARAVEVSDTPPGRGLGASVGSSCANAIAQMRRRPRRESGRATRVRTIRKSTISARTGLMWPESRAVSAK